MKCSDYLTIYNASVNLDYIKAETLLCSERRFGLPWRDRAAMRLAARLMNAAVNMLGRVLERHTGEIEEKAKNDKID